MKIKTACILLGGYGTRMLPITKTIPKEMLPINNMPNIYYIVDELYKNGIKNIIFIVSKRNSNILKNFFSIDKELDDHLGEKKHILDNLYRIINNTNIKYIYQKENGTYGALYSAKNYIKEDYFMVCYGDEYIKGNITEQLLNEFKTNNNMIITAKENEDKTSGLLKLDNNNNLIKITKKEDSNNLELIGRMILNKEIFKVKNKLKYYENNELYLPHSLLNFNNVKCIIPNIKYYNIGELEGYIKANKGE